MLTPTVEIIDYEPCGTGQGKYRPVMQDGLTQSRISIVYCAGVLEFFVLERPEQIHLHWVYPFEHAIDVGLIQAIDCYRVMGRGPTQLVANLPRFEICPGAGICQHKPVVDPDQNI